MGPPFPQTANLQLLGVRGSGDRNKRSLFGGWCERGRLGRSHQPLYMPVEVYSSAAVAYGLLTVTREREVLRDVGLSHIGHFL